MKNFLVHYAYEFTTLAEVYRTEYSFNYPIKNGVNAWIDINGAGEVPIKFTAANIQEELDKVTATQKKVGELDYTMCLREEEKYIYLHRITFGKDLAFDMKNISKEMFYAFDASCMNWIDFKEISQSLGVDVKLVEKGLNAYIVFEVNTRKFNNIFQPIVAQIVQEYNLHV